MATIKLFGVNLAKEIREATKGQLRDITLVKVAAGSRTGGQVTGGTNPTTASHSCEGFIEDYSDREMAEMQLQKGTRRVLIIAGSLPSGVKPQTADRVTVATITYEVLEVTTDPAEATWVCRVRGS